MEAFWATVILASSSLTRCGIGAAEPAQGHAVDAASPGDGGARARRNDAPRLATSSDATVTTRDLRTVEHTGELDRLGHLRRWRDAGGGIYPLNPLKLTELPGTAATIGSMEFFCYHRDRPGSLALRDKLLEEHWSYMDRYATQMIARGPTFTSDGDTLTGSLHIVDLPGPAAARAFAFDEPNYQAGVYRDVLLRRWRNLLGRTMWDFPGGREGGNRYLVLGLGAEPAADLEVPPGRDELIAYGPLVSDDGATWLGTAVLVRAPDPDAAHALLTSGRYAGIEVHDWQFGGRSS